MKKSAFIKKITIIFLIIICIAFFTKMQVFSSSGYESVNQLAHSMRKNMVYVHGGSFMMGPSSDKWNDGTNYPSHKVILSGFYMSKFNTSYADFDLYTKVAKLKKTQPEAIGSYSRTPDHPVISITWYQANRFCKWLAKKTGLPYSLPTEAQWEFAATNRGESNRPFSTNNGKLELGKNFPSHKQEAMQRGNYASIYSAMPNGSYPPNPLGIYDMNGQVNQWILDWFDPNYYSNSPLYNPQGPSTGREKVARGGNAGGTYEDNVYGRAAFKPDIKAAGFRCVINSSVPPNKLGAFAKGYTKH